MIERCNLFENGELVVIAGPCAVESEDQMYQVCRDLKGMDINIMRGMLWKPRTEPGSFQGLGKRGLDILKRIKQDLDVLFVTEIVDKGQLRLTRGISDIIQVGSRNMQNFELLKAVEKDGRPVILKRGLSADLKEWIGAAKYIGLDKVILCERGIRTPNNATRFTMDLNTVAVIKEDPKYAGIPILVDPSHPAGRRDIVPRLINSAVSIGADGIIVEVHNNPDSAQCDGPQQITPGAFREAISKAREIYQILKTA